LDERRVLKVTDEKEERAKRALNTEQHDSANRKGAEARYECILLYNNKEMNFRCSGCGNVIFLARHKAELRTGRSGFTRAVGGSIELVPERRFGTVRTFVHCSRCGRHLGQLLDDGADSAVRKYCINCGALDFE